MAKSFSKGDKVSWSSPGGKTTGTVVEKLTQKTEVAGRQVAASEDEPQYLVESDKSGKRAAHKSRRPTGDLKGVERPPTAFMVRRGRA